MNSAIDILIIVLDSIALVITTGLWFQFRKVLPKSRSSFLLQLFVVELWAYAVLDLVVPNVFWSELVKTALYVSFGPTLFLYIAGFGANTSRRFDAWHAALPLANLVYAAGVLLSGIGQEAYYELEIFYVELFVNFFAVMAYAFLSVVAFLRIKWRDRFADPVKMDWLQTLLIIYLAYTVVAYVYGFAYSAADDNIWIWLFDSVINLLLMGWWAYRANADGMLWTAKAEEENSLSPEKKWDRLYTQIDQTIREEAMFLNPKLRIEDLASKLGTNSRYVSKAVNLGYGDSVTNYLNNMRLERFKEKLQDESSKNLKIDAIATDCGFNSKSAFNRFFKQQEGETPSAYRSRVLNS